MTPERLEELIDSIYYECNGTSNLDVIIRQAIITAINETKEDAAKIADEVANLPKYFGEVTAKHIAEQIRASKIKE